MNTTKPEREFLVERMERYLRQRSNARTTRPESATPPDRSRPSLTISRQCGAGLERLERPLLQYLDELDDDGEGAWALFDQSLIGKIIEENRLPGTAVPFVSENAKFAVAGPLRDRLAASREEWSLFNHFANAIRQVCSSGRALVIGRAANQITSDLDNTFHVRLIADKTKRIRLIARRHETGHAAATEWVEATDETRAAFVKRHTGADIDDPVAYHLILNTDHFADDVAVRVIADSMHEWSRIHSTGPSPEPHPPSAPSIIEGIFPSAARR